MESKRDTQFYENLIRYLLDLNYTEKEKSTKTIEDLKQTVDLLERQLKL